MSEYPNYLSQTLARARTLGQWYAGQAEAAALCFDMLALFPDCREAGELVYELFCDPWLIYDMRVAIQQHIEEWDDRPFQQRRRLALSFDFLSRWEGWENEDDAEEDSQYQENCLDVAALLDDGKMELLHAYCLGDDECTDYAWTIFTKALETTRQPEATLLWIGKQYAKLGFFADAAEVLGELCLRFNNGQARRLLAEVIWWRENAHRIPWLPPPGDGSRYDRIIKIIDPQAPTTQELIAQIRSENHLKRMTKYKPSIDPSLANLLSRTLPPLQQESSPPRIDWSFLEDAWQPGEPADWVKEEIKLMEEFIQQDQENRQFLEKYLRAHRWTRNIPPPSLPKRHDPHQLRFFDAESDADETPFVCT